VHVKCWGDAHRPAAPAMLHVHKQRQIQDANKQRHQQQSLAPAGTKNQVGIKDIAQRCAG
jgi:hypothetical protein